MELRDPIIEPLAVSTIGLPISCKLLTGERLEFSVDMLEVSSEGKNVFVALATYMIRLYGCVGSTLPGHIGSASSWTMKADPASTLFICSESAC